MKPAATGAALAVVAALGTGCAAEINGSAAVAESVIAADRAYATSSLSVRPTASRILTYRTFEEALPNHTYRVGSRRIVLSDSVVVGRIVAVRKGSGFQVPRDVDAVASTEIPFDDERAQWRTVNIEVQVDRQLSGAALGDTVVASIPLYDMRADFSRLSDGILAYGQVLLPLKDRTPVEPKNGATKNIADSGALLAMVGIDGRLSFPLAREGVERDTLDASALTVDGVRAALEQPTVTASPRGIG